MGLLLVIRTVFTNHNNKNTHFFISLFREQKTIFNFEKLQPAPIKLQIRGFSKLTQNSHA